MREEIIKMAREAGAKFNLGEPSSDMVDVLERFFHMAQAAEREECAKVVDENAKQCGIAIRLILKSNAAAIRARGQA